MSAAMKRHFVAVLLLWKEHLLDEMQKTFDHLKAKGETYADPVDRASQEEEFAFELRTRDRERKLISKIAISIEKIKQEVIRVKQGDKYNQLIKEIYIRQGSILIFVKTRRNAEKMVKRLKYDDHDADAIHGNLRQNKRDRVIKAFRNNHFRILVGTDVASRGLDIPAIKHVINFDLPQVPEVFLFIELEDS